jgi:hypothetical protein
LELLEQIETIPRKYQLFSRFFVRRFKCSAIKEGDGRGLGMHRHFINAFDLQQNDLLIANTNGETNSNNKTIMVVKILLKTIHNQINKDM